MHMFSGGFTPWKANPAWRAQVMEERAREMAGQEESKKKKGGSGMSWLMWIAGGGLMWGMLNSGPPPIQ